MVEIKDLPLAKKEWISEKNKDDKIIYWSATDHEGKGYLGKFRNPLLEKAVKVEPKKKVVKKKKTASSLGVMSR